MRTNGLSATPFAVTAACLREKPRSKPRGKLSTPHCNRATPSNSMKQVVGARPRPTPSWPRSVAGVRRYRFENPVATQPLPMPKRTLKPSAHRDSPSAAPHTLAIDIGGTHLKASVLDRLGAEIVAH